MDRYTEQDAIKAVALLTPSLLTLFVEAEIVVPIRTGSQLFFRQIDIARMELLCELHDQFDMGEDALVMVISLIDQLHAVRGEMAALAAAIEAEPAEVRDRLMLALRGR